MPKGKHLFDASKPNLEDFYEDMCSHLSEDALHEFVATMATQHSIFELQVLSEKHTEMGKVIKAYAMWPLIQKDFGKRALTIYDNLIQQDNHKDLSLSRFYQICKKLKEEVEQLRGFISSDEMKFATTLADWPVQSAAELNDLNNFFDKTIKKHYQAIIAHLAKPGLQDLDGRTPLIWAAYKGHFATVKALLVEPGIDVNKADNDSNTPLIWAVWKGHLETVKVLLAQPDIDVNKADNNDHTPLICAIRNSHFEVVKVLLDKTDIDVNKEDINGETPLNWAALRGYPEIVKALLVHSGIHVDKAGDYGNTPLILAARYGHLKTVNLLLVQQGIDVNKANNGGNTPLALAAYNGHLETVKVLLDKPGIDINKANNNGRTPLYWAESRGHEEIVSLIKNHIASKSNSATAVLVPKGEYLFDASNPKLEDFYKDLYLNLPAVILHEFVATMATQHSIFELQFLSEKHAGMGEVIKTYAMRPLIQKDLGEKALTIYDKLIQQDGYKDLSLSTYYQICEKLKEEVEQLREFINLVEMKFVTALADWPVQSAAELSDLNNFFDKAIKNHYQTIIAYLAKPVLQDLDGGTPLIWASLKGHSATVKALLTQPGIDVNKADNDGNTPLNWAAFMGHLEVVKVLLARPGIDVNKADNDGITPLYWTKFRGYEEIASLIKNHIASKSNKVTGSLATLCYASLRNQGAASNGAVSRSHQNNCCII